ncbi:hypothetical protein [Accumulibacter sp.]|uniref:hypothetical protein n=1 Tax=Accumulibacter sp. TaxID=2053492 RepID=UPI00260F0524|nr:hypothetical protein [Accumulibacter sp.]
MPHPTPAPAAPIREPLTLQAARISSIAVAANLALSGSALADRRAAETIALDLMDVVAILVARLVADAEILESQSQGA